jgi:hypothetical protein
LVETSVHIIAGMTVCSRIADVWTTYLVTPTLKLEANSLVRRFGWRYAIITVCIGLIPYLSPEMGVVILTASFLVAASNASKIIMARALGEHELAALMHRVLLSTPPWPGLLFLLLPALLYALLGGCILFFYPDASEWGYFIGMGMLTYSLAMTFWYPVRFVRARAEAQLKGTLISK